MPFVRAADEAAPRPRRRPAEIPALVDEALRDRAARRTPGPAFLDLPLDVVFMEARGAEPATPTLPDRAAEPAADGDAIERAAALLRERRAAGDHGRHRPLLGARRGRAARAVREALRIPVFLNGLARGCVPADHELFFSRARGAGAQGRRRRARDRRADGLPARLRRRRSARTPRSSSIDRAEPEREPPARRRGRALRRHRARRSTRCARRRAAALERATARWVARAARGREREARRPRQAELERRPRAAAPDARLQRARRGARPRRDRDRRRRRLRLLRRPRDRHLRAGLLARPGPVRLPGLRARLRARGEARAPRPPGRAAARRRRVRLLAGWSSTRWCATACPSSA